MRGLAPSPCLAKDRQPSSQPHTCGTQGNRLRVSSFQGPIWELVGGGGCRVSPLRRRIEGRGQSSEGSEPSTGGPWGLGGRAWARVSLAAVPHILFLAVAKMLGVDPFLRGLS